jgi:ABC-type sugar transport system substrate-binding protein
MGRNHVVAVTVALVLAAPATGVAASSRAAQPSYTVAFVADGLPSSRDEAIARGGRAAAKALGIRFLLRGSGSDLTGVYTSLLAQHVDAIATEGYDPSLTATLDKVRAAGVPLLSSGDDIAAARTLWVNQSDATAYAQALADALASQLKGRGEYAIVDQRGQYPIATEWERLAKAYIGRTYPAMKLDGTFAGSDRTGRPEPARVEAYMRAHPKLKGLLAVVPRAADAVALAITQARRLGQVFSAGNGGGDFTAPLPGWVRSGAAELVFASDPAKLGYLTAWAANYLLTGHTFKPGAYEVGGPIGLVRYYAAHRELRLGQPLTITKTNVELYANKF